MPALKVSKRPNAWYGWRPDKPDQRDFVYDHKARLIGPQLPPSIDLRDECPPILDQGQLGSCTANAISSAVEFDRLKQGIRDWCPSRLFIYYQERVIEGTVSEDSGAEIRDGIKSVNKVGAPPENFWPYTISKFATKPNARAYRSAAKHPSLTYMRVDQSWDAVRSALADKLLVVFGFTVYDSFESAKVARTGIVPMPGRREGVLGGHAVCACGYDSEANRFICRNSWATDWGMKGYFTMPRDYVLSSDLASDFWVIQTVK